MYGTDHDHREYAEQGVLDMARHDLEQTDAHLQTQVWDLKQELGELRLELARLRVELSEVSAAADPDGAEPNRAADYEQARREALTERAEAANRET